MQGRTESKGGNSDVNLITLEEDASNFLTSCSFPNDENLKMLPIKTNNNNKKKQELEIPCWNYQIMYIELNK